MQILTYFSSLARRGHEAAATAALQAQEMSRSPAKISSCSMRAAHKAEATILPPRQQDHNHLVQQCLLWLRSTWKPSALPVQQANHARKILKEKNRETGGVSFSSSSTRGSFSLLLRKLRLSNQIFVLEYLPKSHRPARSVWKVSGLQPLLTPESSQPSYCNQKWNRTSRIHTQFT